MAAFNFRSAVAASTTYTPLVGWQYEYSPWMASLKLLIDSNQVDSTVFVSSGTETIQENSAILQNTNNLSDLYVPAIRWRAAPGDRLKCLVTTVTAATIRGQLIIAQIGR